MTPGANSLTERVKPASPSLSTWSMPASDVRVFTNAFQRLGYHVEPLLAAAGIRADDLTDPDVRVPCEALGMLVARAQAQRFTLNLALELARVTPIGDYRCSTISCSRPTPSVPASSSSRATSASSAARRSPRA